MLAAQTAHEKSQEVSVLAVIHDDQLRSGLRRAAAVLAKSGIERGASGMLPRLEGQPDSRHYPELDFRGATAR